MRSSALLALVFLLFISPFANAQGVIVNFDPSSQGIGPFPSDFLTVADSAQKTGLRINLPTPNCAASPSACIEVAALNQLDGFNLQPRISARFSGAINPDSLAPGIAIVWLENLATDEVGQGSPGRVSTINQVIYDPSTQTAYAKSDAFLDQHRRFALVVTDSVRDLSGAPVQADPAFAACIAQPANSYCAALQQAMPTLNAAVAPQRVIAASLFTTMSATSWLEKARDLLPQVALNFQSVGSRRAADLIGVNPRFQTELNPPRFQDNPLIVPAGVFTGVDRIVFGSYQSPNFLNGQQVIPNTPTAASLAAPATTNQISFTAFIPSSAMPANGYPVVIYGHGSGGNNFIDAAVVSSNFARAGFLTIAIDAVGHGYGPQSVLQFQEASGLSQVPFPGRGMDVNGDNVVADDEGCILAWPNPSGGRDCVRQTVVDLMQLSRLVRSGISIDGASGLRMDSNRIYYSGVSLGAIYGTVLHAIDPGIRAAGVSVGGGPVVDISRWTRNPAVRGLLRSVLASHQPSLLNAGADFNENYVLRNRPVKVNSVSGAIEIQNFIETLEWLQASGDATSYAPHLKQTPLGGVPAKPTLFQFSLGDQQSPNPQNSALIRAANMRTSSTLYRHDIATAAARMLAGLTLPEDPHPFLEGVTSFGPAVALIANAMQSQFAGFFAADGQSIPNANTPIRALLGIDIFETPPDYIETLNYASNPYVVPSRGGVSLSSDGAGNNVTVGYGRIQAAAGNTAPPGIAIFGFHVNNILVSEAGVPSSPLTQSGRIYLEVSGPVNTGVAIANPGDQPATVSFFFSDAAGADFGAGTTVVPANGQIAKFLDQAPFNSGNNVRGTFTFSASVPVSLVALRGFTNERGEFLITTLPVVSTSAAPSSRPVVLPHFADGGGWTTQVVLVNSSDTAMSGAIQFTNAGGQLTTLTANGQAQSSFAYTVPRRSSFRLLTAGGGTLTQSGAVHVVPSAGSNAPTAQAIFTYKPAGVTVSEAGVPSVAGQAFRMYAEVSGSPGAPGSIQTGVAIANSAATAATVNFEWTRLDGGLPGFTASVTIPPNGQSVKFLNEIFAGQPVPASMQGVLRISTTAPEIVVVGLRGRYNERGDFLITTTPPADEASPPSAVDLYFPHLANGGGYTTQFILFNGAGGQPRSGTLRFAGQDGAPLFLNVND